MEEQPQNLVLHVRNTFLNVTDLNKEALKLSRSKSDSSLSQSDSSLSASSAPAQSQSDEQPMVAVGEWHWASTDQRQLSASSTSGSVGSPQLIDVERDAHDDLAERMLELADGLGESFSGAASSGGCSSSGEPSQDNDTSAKAKEGYVGAAAACSTQGGHARTSDAARSADAVAHNADDVEEDDTWRLRMSWSVGSELHSVGKCKPCAWNWQPTGCIEGVNCIRCHLCDDHAFVDHRRDRLATLRASREKRKQNKLAARAAGLGLEG